MMAARAGHTASLLKSGKVLIAGGQDKNYNCLASAELYDPASGTFSATGSLTTSRFLATATLLSDGKVLIAGGQDCDGSFRPLASAELYDPAKGTFSATSSMADARYAHTATLLSDGKVLMAGGYGGSASTYLASAEVYDPVRGTFSPTASMTTVRDFHTATLLSDGKVLIAGGSNGAAPGASTELYDEAAGTFSATGSMETARGGHTATRLPNGSVLITGGADSNGDCLASAETYGPGHATSSLTGSMTDPRAWATATLLSDGRVLVAGGDSAGGSPTAAADLNSADLYDPVRGTFSPTGAMTVARYTHTATLLADGRVLIVGGYGSSDNTAVGSAELYEP
jgi:WD40 repeat protein